MLHICAELEIQFSQSAELDATGEAADLLQQLKKKVELVEQNSTQISQCLGDIRQAANALQLNVSALDKMRKEFYQKVCASLLMAHIHPGLGTCWCATLYWNYIQDTITTIHMS